MTIEVDVASMTTDTDQLTGHLKSPDFFDVAKFPKANFESTSIQVGGSSGATHTIVGNLTMHGITKSVTFPATIKLEPSAIDATSEFAINRKDWGLVYPGMPDDLIKDEVLLKLSLHASRAKS